LRALIYLSLMGKTGLVEVAELCAANASYGWQKLTAIPGVKPVFHANFFNEFALSVPANAADVISALIDKGIAAGFPAGRYYRGMESVLLVAFTEKRTKEEIDCLAAAFGSGALLKRATDRRRKKTLPAKTREKERETGICFF